MAFLGCRSDDFGIVNALGLAARRRLARRTSSRQRHSVFRPLQVVTEY
jgi:hypothetical protein